MKPKKYKTKSGKELWEFFIYISRDPKTGKQIIRHRKGFKTRNSALIAYAKMLEERKNGAFSPKALESENLTVSEVYEMWHAEYSIGVEMSTLSKIESYFNNHIIPDIGDYPIQVISASKLQSQINRWASEAKTGVTWGRYLKQVFQYALLNEIIFRNPFDAVTTPKRVNTTNERKHEIFLNSEQLTRFLKHWESRPIKQYAFFRLLAYTGMRRGEITALTWEDIDFDKRTVTINKAVGLDYRGGTTNKYLKSTKSKSGNRIISLDGSTLAIMEQYRNSTIALPNSPIWPGKHGYMDFNVPERWIQRMRQNLTPENSDLEYVTIHGLRHTHATLLFEQAAQQGRSAPIKAVQKRLGHADVSVTLQIYSHATDKDNEIIDDILENGLNY